MTANFQSAVHDCLNMLRCNAACGSLCCGGCSEANHLRDIDLLADHAHRLLVDSWHAKLNKVSAIRI